MDNDKLRSASVLILGRFDTPTHHLASYITPRAKELKMIKTNIHILDHVPMIDILTCKRGSVLRVRKIMNPFRSYSLRPAVRNLQLALVYVMYNLCVFFYLCTHRNFDLVIGIGPFSGLLASGYKFINGKSKVVYYAEDKISATLRDIINRLTYIADSFARAKSDSVWVMSEKLYARQTAQDKKRYSFVPIPIIPYGRKKVRKHIKRPRQIVFVGAVVLEHGYDLLYRVFRKLISVVPDIRLVIIGAGAYADTLRAMIIRDNLQDAIEYKGYISDQEKILRYIKESDIGVCFYNPYLYKNLAYGQSAKITMYMACGLPVVVTGIRNNMPSFAQHIKKYQAGLVIPYNDASAYGALHRLLTDWAFYKNMKNNTDGIIKLFDSQKYYKDAFQKILH